MKLPFRILVGVLPAFLALRAILARRRRFDLKDVVVLVTGGGRGLGLQVAREAAKRGARLALCSRSEPELSAAREELAASGAIVETFVCDVRDESSIRAAVEHFVRVLGPIDVAVNIAGVIEVGPVDALSMADYEDAIQTNLLGPIRVVESVRESMVERRRGRIVNVTSLGGKISIPHLLPYSASKFGLVGYSEGLRTELGRYDVFVTTIVPGLMRTGSAPQATFAGQPKKEYAMFAPSDALPFTSVSVEHAAREILDACQAGETERVISWQAKSAIALYAIFPRLVIGFLTAFTRLLPDAGGSTEHRYGRDSESPLTQSPLDALAHRATVTQNEALDQTPR
jgi:NAD(P)-dependent dehydrogenase (short-subunit alcohol dehydrogenase family)